jgi:hypothetical protein
VRHFAEEEALVLPVLRAGAAPLAERMSREHREIEALAQAVEDADAPADALPAFADVLAAHIRFEEREAFPAAERLGVGNASPNTPPR